MIGKAVVALIKADATLNTLIAGRVAPWPLPQKMTFPAVAFVVEDKPSNGCDNGTTIIQNEVTVHIMAETLLEAETVGQEIKRVLHRFNGLAGGVQVQSIVYANGGDDFDDELRKHYIDQMYRATVLT